MARETHRAANPSHASFMVEIYSVPDMGMPIGTLP